MKIFNQKGNIHVLPLLVIVAVVGVISFLLLSSVAPFGGGLFGILNPKPDSHAATAVSIDGSQRFQTIDGFGANINPKNWSRYGGNLPPALDFLSDDLGSTLFRVDIFGKSNWEATNDDTNASNFNWTYYNNLYSTEYFNDLWSTIGYLNNKPNAKVILSASGVVPDWMGGQFVQNEDEWVEEVLSVVYYARNTKHLRIDLFDPMNETDIGPPEGPLVDSAQAVRMLHKLVVRMDQLGLGDIKLLPPQIANIDNGQTYLNSLFSDSLVMSRVDHVGFHNYNGYTANISATILGSAYSNRNWWMSEYSQNITDGWLDNGTQVQNEWNFADIMNQQLLKLLSSNGPAAALVWDGYDNVHDHCNCTNISRWGLLAVDSGGIYTPKPRYFATKLVFKTVLPGMIRVRTGNEPDVLAFYNPATGKVSVVGRNPSSSSQVYTFNLNNISSTPTLEFYQTNSNLNFVKGSNVSSSNNSFNVTIPAFTYFALSNSLLTTTQPTPTPVPTPTRTPTPVPTPTRTPSPTPSPTCSKGPQGDADCDGAIGIFDYSAVITHFNQSGTNILGDVDKDGTVGIFDYSIVVTHFGQ